MYIDTYICRYIPVIFLCTYLLYLLSEAIAAQPFLSDRPHVVGIQIGQWAMVITPFVAEVIKDNGQLRGDVRYYDLFCPFYNRCFVSSNTNNAEKFYSKILLYALLFNLCYFPLAFKDDLVRLKVLLILTPLHKCRILH